LTLDEFWIFGEKENASLQSDFVRPLFDLAFQERIDHGNPEVFDWPLPGAEQASVPTRSL
jgi:hypothetical protein